MTLDPHMSLGQISYYTASVLLAVGIICFQVLLLLLARHVWGMRTQYVHRTPPPQLPTEPLEPSVLQQFERDPLSNSLEQQP